MERISQNNSLVWPEKSEGRSDQPEGETNKIQAIPQLIKCQPDTSVNQGLGMTAYTL